MLATFQKRFSLYSIFSINLQQKENETQFIDLKR